MEYELVRPDFLKAEKVDEKTIHDRMLLFLAQRNIDTTEGGFAWDMTRPAATELAQAYDLLYQTIQIMFPAWSYSGWLDLHGLSSGVYRKEAVASSGVLHITGVPNMVIEKGLKFATPSVDGEESVIFTLDADCTLLDPEGTGTGEADASVACVTAGTEGNVPANSVTLMVVPKNGVSSITNPAAITGGTDEESDDDYRDRIMVNDIETEESFVGSIADFKRWAKTVDGVGNVVVLPTWNGPGTVKLVVVDESNAPANAKLIKDVYDYIMSPDAPDSRIAPIGCVLKVVAPDIYLVNVSAVVSIDVSITNIAAVNASFKAAMDAYFNEAAVDNVVRYTRVGGILSGIEGVRDYHSLLLNGGTGNLTLTTEQYPMSGTIGVTTE